eukprot:9128264-Pyramimonas_sp.AAC.1
MDPVLQKKNEKLEKLEPVMDKPESALEKLEKPQLGSNAATAASSGAGHAEDPAQSDGETEWTA